MKRHTALLLLLLTALAANAKSRILDPRVKSLQVVVNRDWLSPPVMRLGAGDVLNVAFDELSHDYHRYIYRLEHCEDDWTPSEDIFESDWLEGFNDNTIDDYATSINTTVAYTHYSLQLPNERCRLKLSGNYRLRIIDDDGSEVAVAEFMVTEQSMQLACSVTANTVVDTHASHQEVSMVLNYGNSIVTYPDEQIHTVVRQNQREDNQRQNVKPDRYNISNGKGQAWAYNRQLVFEAGNEYHKFEVLDVSHPTMGIDFIRWDGDTYQAYPFTDEPRPNYLYDEDADGAFYIRNSDNRENDIISDYVWVNYRLRMPPLAEGRIIIDGHWTTDDDLQHYTMTYNAEEGLYEAAILQKQGYYSYQYLWLRDDGTTALLPSEGSFYQTENRYQAYVYFKGTGERTWRLTAYSEFGDFNR